MQVHPDSLVILARLSGDENLALGRSVKDEFGKEVPLSDGSIALVRSEWISGTHKRVGQDFTVDLGLDRAISRVRVLAGETARSQPEYFVRGYRLQAATQRAPQVWTLLAEEPANFEFNVDTRRDSTWSAVDEQGAAIPRLGRFVRLTLIRQDRSNWVAIGEIEVYGVGFVSEGYLEGHFVPPTPVNVGQIRWQVERPPRTQVELRLRGTISIARRLPGRSRTPMPRTRLSLLATNRLSSWSIRSSCSPRRPSVRRRYSVSKSITIRSWWPISCWLRWTCRIR